MENLKAVFEKTDWGMLKEQKAALIEEIGINDPKTAPLEGLLNWIDALQDAAELDGYPVQFTGEPEVLTIRRARTPKTNERNERIK